MKIKLTKSTTIAGEKFRASSIHDLDDKIAAKLISRGLAKEHSGKQSVEAEEDGSTVS